MASPTDKKEKDIVKGPRRFQDVPYPTVYSNMMGLGATAFDISIIFGEVDHDQKSNEMVAVPRVKVTLAPEQAANLINMLENILPRYVAANGKLRHGGKIDGIEQEEIYESR